MRLQTEACPAGEPVTVDNLGPLNNPIAYFVDYLRTGREVDGPLSPAVSRIGQQIVNAGRCKRPEEKRVVTL